MTTNLCVDAPGGTFILNAEEWLKAEFGVEQSKVLIGTPDNPIIRPLTKNLVEASDKSFKTTFLLRLTLAMASGTSAYPSLPVVRPRKILYLHGELAPSELKERLQDAARDLPRPLGNFFQGRSLDASLVTPDGQKVLRQVVDLYQPEVLVIDPWQSFIAGADENSFKDVSGAIAFMDKLVADCGLTLFLAIHFGKDASRGARGHSALAGWRDTKFTLKRAGNGLSVAVEPRWAKPPDPLKLRFKDGTLWEGDGPTWTRQQERIRELVVASGGQITKKAVGVILELEDSALRMALKRAIDDHAITVVGDIVRVPA